LHTPGATSFTDLLTVGGVCYSSFKEACHLLHLLNDDTQWHNTIAEAATFQMPFQLRRIFVTMLTHCNPSNPLQLWKEYKTSLLEDYLKHMPENEAIQCGLRALKFINSLHKLVNP